MFIQNFTWGQNSDDDAGHTCTEARQGHGYHKQDRSSDPFDQVINDVLDEPGHRLGEETGVWSIFKSFKIFSNVVPLNLNKKGSNKCMNE